MLTAYKDDATKYAKNENEANIIRHIIETAATETGNRIVFEKFGKSSFRSKDVGEAMKKLERTMLLYMRYPVTSGDLPLIPDMKLRPRLQFLDAGLQNYALGMTSAYFTEETWSDSYRGMLAEQVAGQELLAQKNGTIQKPNFWVREKKQSNAEVDFFDCEGRLRDSSRNQKRKIGNAKIATPVHRRERARLRHTTLQRRCRRRTRDYT